MQFTFDVFNRLGTILVKYSGKCHLQPIQGQTSQLCCTDCRTKPPSGGKFLLFLIHHYQTIPSVQVEHVAFRFFKQSKYNAICIETMQLSRHACIVVCYVKRWLRYVDGRPCYRQQAWMYLDVYWTHSIPISCVDSITNIR